MPRRRAQKGSADCFIRLMEENKQTLMRVAYGFFQNEEDVADAVAQTVADAYEHIRELKKPETVSDFSFFVLQLLDWKKWKIDA